MKYGRYEILEEIGKGSMGVVYKARDPNLDLVVALKVLRRDRLDNESLVNRFVSEARALGRLDHPNIVRVFNVDDDQGSVYIVMEYVEGDSFAGHMKEMRSDPARIAEIGATIAEALDSAHRKGIVHRDVKPGNILIKGDGTLKITDFGIAHIEDSSMAEKTQAGEILGTPAYMSPEQVLSRHVDGRSDIFSLGIILYEMAAGARPFGGTGFNAIFNAITQEEPVEIRSLNSDLPKPLADAIMKCLRKSPGERFADGRELAAALRESVGAGRGAAAPLAPPAAAAHPRRPLVYGAAAGVLLAVCGLSLYYCSRNPPPPLQQPASIAEKALLSVSSTPEGAQIFIDGTLKGTTPNRIRLPAGKHEIRLNLPHYYEWEAQVEVADDVETPLTVKLLPLSDK